MDMVVMVACLPLLLVLLRMRSFCLVSIVVIDVTVAGIAIAVCGRMKILNVVRSVERGLRLERASPPFKFVYACVYAWAELSRHLWLRHVRLYKTEGGPSSHFAMCAVRICTTLSTLHPRLVLHKRFGQTSPVRARYQLRLEEGMYLFQNLILSAW